MRIHVLLPIAEMKINDMSQVKKDIKDITIAALAGVTGVLALCLIVVTVLFIITLRRYI